MLICDEIYSASEQRIIDELDKWVAGDAKGKLPVKPKDIVEGLTPWPKRASREFLRVDGFDVLCVRTKDEDDPNAPYYVFVTPDEKVLWPPDGTPICTHCGVVAPLVEDKDGKRKGEPKPRNRHGYADRPNKIKDLPFHGKRRFITVLYRRYMCLSCKQTYRAPWEHFSVENQQFTNRLVTAVRNASMTKRSFEMVAYDYAVDDETVRKYFREEVEYRRENLQIKTPEHIGIDESKVHTKDGGHFYVAILDTGPKPQHNGIIEIDVVRRDTETIEEVFRRFENPRAVKTISMDMCGAYRAAAESQLKNARIIVDRFHLVHSLNDKVSETASELYKKLKKELEKELKIAPIPDEFDPALSDFDEEDDDIISEEADKSSETFFAFSTSAVKVPETLPRNEYLQRRLDILKEGYHHRRFIMNPDKMSDLSQVRMHRLLINFPEFRNLFDIKEYMRYHFFHAKDADTARRIADMAFAMIPKVRGTGAIYEPLKKYFRTLNDSEWTTHIYSYFEDPISHPVHFDGDGNLVSPNPKDKDGKPKPRLHKRYSNAKLEGFNKIVKEINAAARGLSWDELRAKLLLGDLTTPHRKRTYERKKKEEAVAMCLPLARDYLEKYDYAPSYAPSKSEWEVVFSIPVVKELMGQPWATYSDTGTEDYLQKLYENNNLRGALYSLLSDEDKIYSSLLTEGDDDGDGDDADGPPLIQPLRFSDWEANKDKYLAMIASDVQFLDRLDHK